MAEILLLHHVQGLTPGLIDFAAGLRSAGHTVHTPDLFDGRTFATIEQGLAHAKSVGFATLHERASGAAAPLPEALVYLGFSIGVMDAQRLAQTRAGAAGAVLLDSCAPLGEFAPGWPAGVPVQIHGGEPARSPTTRGLQPSSSSASSPSWPGSGPVRRGAPSGPGPDQGVGDLVGACAVGVGQAADEQSLPGEAGPLGGLAGCDVADLVPELQPLEVRLREDPAADEGQRP